MEQYTLVKNSNNTGQIVKGKSPPFLSLAHLYVNCPSDEFEENGPVIF